MPAAASTTLRSMAWRGFAPPSPCLAPAAVADLDWVLTNLARRLDVAGVPYMVIGGLANALWGAPRETVDINVTARFAPDEIPQLLKADDTFRFRTHVSSASATRRTPSR